MASSNTASAVFDAWGTGIVSGLIGAVPVIVGVWLTQRLSDARRRDTDRRAAADALMLEASNARDAVLSNRVGLSGEFDLWPFRQRLFITQSMIGQYPAYQEAVAFYDAIYEYRGVVKARNRTDHHVLDDETWKKRIAEYRRVIDDWECQLRGHLQRAYEDPTLLWQRPQLPSLRS